MPYLISYDLSEPDQKYEELADAIESLGKCRKVLQSVWITMHRGPCTAIRNVLMEHVDEDDRLIVLELKGEWATSNFPKDDRDWLEENL